MSGTLATLGIPAATAIIAALLAYLGARFQGRAQAMSSAEKEERELVAALRASVAEVKGTALDIREVRTEVVQVRFGLEALEQTLRLVPSDALTASGPNVEPLVELMNANPMLGHRVRSNIASKQAMGAFLARFIRQGDSALVDCGTSVAWALHRTLVQGVSFSSVLTNNLLVAAMFGDENGSDGEDDVLMAQELPSRCRLIPGRYFPAYAAVFPDDEDSLSAYLNQWSARADWIVVGSTSLELLSGPRGRSDGNRLFKSSLLSEAVKQVDANVAVVVDLDKLGIQLGSPADIAAWHEILRREKTRVIVGGDPRKVGGQALARAAEEISKYVEGRKNEGWMLGLHFIDESGKEIPHARIRGGT